MNATLFPIIIYHVAIYPFVMSFKRCFPQKVRSSPGVPESFDSLSISPENFFRYANTGLRESIFMEQLALIEKHKQWFIKMHLGDDQC
jgi:hypothetical protein